MSDMVKMLQSMLRIFVRVGGQNTTGNASLLQTTIAVASGYFNLLCHRERQVAWPMTLCDDNASAIAPRIDI
jgi:hypothetical protein